MEGAQCDSSNDPQNEKETGLEQQKGTTTKKNKKKTKNTKKTNKQNKKKTKKKQKRVLLGPASGGTGLV